MRFQRTSAVCVFDAVDCKPGFRVRHDIIAAAAASILMSGCAGGGSGGLGAASLPVIPATGSSDDGYLTTATGAVIPVYARLARGLNTCWLRSDRPLGKAFVLHATVAPPPAQTAEMVIHFRSETGRRGLKAFTVNLASNGDATSVHAINLKLPDTQGRRIAADIARWGRGERACESEANWVPDVSETATVEKVPADEYGTSGKN